MLLLPAVNEDGSPRDHRKDDKPDTCINWVKGKSLDDGSYVKIPNGGVTTSHQFIVDFQSTATDTGKGSHVDLRIDDGRYKPVASPYKFKITSLGEHTIYLKGVDKWGNEDPSPAKFTVIITKKRAYPPSDDDGNPETWINSVRTPVGKNIANGGSTSSKVVTVDFQGTVAGKGSHIDLSIDGGRYKPVASPRTISLTSVSALIQYTSER